MERDIPTERTKSRRVRGQWHLQRILADPSRTPFHHELSSVYTNEDRSSVFRGDDHIGGNEE